MLGLQVQQNSLNTPPWVLDNSKRGDNHYFVILLATQNIHDNKKLVANLNNKKTKKE